METNTAIDWIKFASIVISVSGAVIWIFKYFISQWKDIEAMKAEKTQTAAELTKLKDGLNTTSERLTAAIEKNNKENELRIEKLRSETTDKMAAIESNHYATTQEVFKKLETINIGIVEIKADFKNVNSVLANHDDAIKDSQKSRQEFYEKFGGILSLMPAFLAGKTNGKSDS